MRMTGTLKEGEMLLVGPSSIDLALVIQRFLHRSFYNLKINIFNNLISIIVRWDNLPEDYGWSIVFWEIKNEISFVCSAAIY